MALYNCNMELNNLLSPFRRAINEYRMIESGDKVAVGVSGGKDSLALLTMLAAYQKYFGVPFDLLAVTIDMGFEQSDFDPVARYCARGKLQHC